MIFETVIALLFIFAVLVMFHELGHFLAARAVGIRVEEFAFGFGPKLITLFKRGDTEYTIHPIPAGGFVKLAGMEPGQEDVTDGFQAQSIPKRALVIFAGPFASFVLAVVVFLLMGVFWGYPDLTAPAQNKVGIVNPQTEAARIGLRGGDRIVEIDGVEITEGRQMTDLIHGNPGEKIELTVRRNGNNITKTATPRWVIEYLGAAWSFMEGNEGTIQNILEKSPAKRAGLEKGDRIVSIDGRQIGGGGDMEAAIEKAGRDQVTLVVERDGKTVTARAKPSIEWVRFMGARWIFPGAYADKVSEGSRFKYADLLVNINGVEFKSGEELLEYLRETNGRKLDVVVNRDGKEQTVALTASPSDYRRIESGVYSAMGLLGFQPEPRLVKAGLGESLSRGLRITWNIVLQLVDVLTSSRIKEEVGGPIMIAKMTQSAVMRGSYWVMTMLGGLSMSLAFINLVPIPGILDGGHLALLGVEAARRKRFTEDQMRAIQLVGLAMLFVIVVLVVWSDLFKITQGLVPQ